MVNEADVRLFADKCKAIFEQVGRDIIGQEDIVELTVIAMIAGGNVLLEGVPGIGKTRLIRSLGRVFSLPFSRIQFTPDLMPADITGTNVLEKDEKGNAVYTFRPGPIFSHIVLADEINRATPKSQSALLEAMQEHTVTVDGKDYHMEEPFFVLATQNPIEQEGTYALPEAQVDRFMFKLLMRYPTVEEMKQIVLMTQKTMDEVADGVVDGETLLRMRETAKEIPGHGRHHQLHDAPGVLDAALLAGGGRDRRADDPFGRESARRAGAHHLRKGARHGIRPLQRQPRGHRRAGLPGAAPPREAQL